MRKANSAVALVGAAGMLAGLASPAGATTNAEAEASETAVAKRGVCKGIKKCYVVGHVDVTGDGRRDWVGAVNRNGRTVKKGAVTIRVLSKGKIRKKRVRVRNWRGNVFHGIARIDGRPGAELVVGANRKRYRQRDRSGKIRISHKKAFHVLTFRQGRLIRERVPGAKTRVWWLTPRMGVRSGDVSMPDNATSQSRGYYRKVNRGRVRMVRKNAACRGFTGCSAQRATFVWRKGRWVRKSVNRGSLNAKGGWHVKGLKIW